MLPVMGTGDRSKRDAVIKTGKDFAFFQGWGLPIPFAYPNSVKPAWQHLLGKSKARKTAMFYRGLFYLSYSKPAGASLLK